MRVFREVRGGLGMDDWGILVLIVAVAILMIARTKGGG